MKTAVAFGVMFAVWFVYFQFIDWALMKYQGLDYFFNFR